MIINKTIEQKLSTQIPTDSNTDNNNIYVTFVKATAYTFMLHVLFLLPWTEQPFFRALDKRDYLVIIRDKFCFSAH